MSETRDQQIMRLNRDRTDRQYMIDALVPMLGPKGREVWALWQAKGVTRIHTSWAFDPMTIAGEDVAELHLKMEAAMAGAVLVDDIDAANPGAILQADNSPLSHRPKSLGVRSLKRTPPPPAGADDGIA